MGNRLAIGIATAGSIKPETTLSLMMAFKQAPYEMGVKIIDSAYVHDARNKLALWAIKGECDRLLFIDSDMVFPKDAIEHLWNDDKDIVGAAYNRRELPPKLAVLEGKFISDLHPADFGLMTARKPVKVAVVPTGMMMIKTAVFKKVPPPWFDFHPTPETFLGEDAYFCWKAKQNGIDVWCDPTLLVRHIGNYSY